MPIRGAGANVRFGRPAPDAGAAAGPATGAGAAQNATVLPVTSALAYATAAADLGGGAGSWVNPGNADGAPDSAYATWTSP